MHAGMAAMAFAVAVGAILSRFRRSRRSAAATPGDSAPYPYSTSVDLQLKAALDAAKHRRSVSMERSSSLVAPLAGEAPPVRYTHDGATGRAARRGAGKGHLAGGGREWYDDGERSMQRSMHSSAATCAPAPLRHSETWQYGERPVHSFATPHQHSVGYPPEIIEVPRMYVPMHAEPQRVPMRASLDSRRPPPPQRHDASVDFRAAAATAQRAAPRRTMDALREPLDWARSALLGRRRTPAQHKAAAPAAERSARVATASAELLPADPLAALVRSSVGSSHAQGVGSAGSAGSGGRPARVSPVHNLLLESCSSSDEITAMRDLVHGEVCRATPCPVAPTLCSACSCVTHPSSYGNQRICALLTNHRRGSIDDLCWCAGGQYILQ